MKRAPRNNRQSRLVPMLFVSILLLAVGVAATLFLLRNRVIHAMNLTSQVRVAFERGDTQAGCTAAARAANAWGNADALSQPLAPLLVRLSWVPSVGQTLKVTPSLVTMAHRGTLAMVDGCTLLQPMLTQPSLAEQLKVGVAQLNADPAKLDQIVANVEQSRVALASIENDLDTVAQLAPYRDQLRQIRPALLRVSTLLEALREARPSLSALLGFDAARQYLLVLQNPFELRPTGGFMGVVCVLQVQQAQMSVDECQSSETYAEPAPPSMTIPTPYARYLRLGSYYLRDANWSPDFPTTAERLQEFWALNGQVPVDGVIAIDVFAFQTLLEATGPLKLDGGVRVSSKNVVDTLLARYYDGRIRRDKIGIGSMLSSFISGLSDGESVSPLKMANAVYTMMNEEHVLVHLNDPALARFQELLGWSGAMHADTTTYLKVVDADVGYGGVNAFIERLTQYDVHMDASGEPITATATLTYTNRYSPWAEAPTSYAVYGKCADPESFELERHAGCYANFVRVYVGEGSTLLSLTGLDQVYDPDARYGMSIFGGYMRLFPGEQRVIHLTYRIAPTTNRTIVVAKQAGTPQAPVHVVVRSGAERAERWSSGRTDLRLAYAVGGSTLGLSGADDPVVVLAFRRNAAFERGVQAWQRGDRAGAIATWKDEDTWDLVLDRVRWLGAQNRIDEALDLLNSAVPPSARARFEHAALLERNGAVAEAIPLYAEAYEAQPDNSLAHLSYIHSLYVVGQPVPESVAGKVAAAARRRWSNQARQLQQDSALREALDYWQALLFLAPDDDELTMRVADLLVRDGRTDTALELYRRVSQHPGTWNRLAVASIAAMEGDRTNAIRIYRNAIANAKTSNISLRIGDGLAALDAFTEAQAAYEQAVQQDPGNTRPLTALGDLWKDRDHDIAREWYLRARNIIPETGYPVTGYPDFALGALLVEQGKSEEALEYAESAVSRNPEDARFRSLLERIRADLGSVN